MADYQLRVKTLYEKHCDLSIKTVHGDPDDDTYHYDAIARKWCRWFHGLSDVEGFYQLLRTEGFEYTAYMTAAEQRQQVSQLYKEATVEARRA